MKWLDELDGNGCLGIGFGGGEPTLFPDLPALCRHAAQKTGLAVTLTTHGHHLDKRLVAALAGNVHFVRVSMDGIGATYDFLRGRSFETFLERLEWVRSLAPFGINYVVNAQTLPHLRAATELAEHLGATEFLLLPEQPAKATNGIDKRSIDELVSWIKNYRGRIPLAISETGAGMAPTCDPLAKEPGLRAYAHISASGVLKFSSYDNDGVEIGEDHLMSALSTLRARKQETD